MELKLSDAVAKLADAGKAGNMNETNQLKIADELEKVLGDMGIEVQPKFDIPTSQRVGSFFPLPSGNK